MWRCWRGHTKGRILVIPVSYMAEQKRAVDLEGKLGSSLSRCRSGLRAAALLPGLAYASTLSIQVL